MNTIKKALILASIALIPSLTFAYNSIFDDKDELRGGILQHDTTIDLGHRCERGQDLNLEYLFPLPPGKVLDFLLTPRGHVGASINNAGATHQFYAGITWHFDIYKTLFLEASFGGEGHTGKLDTRTSRKNALGTRFLFRESISIGSLFSERHSLSIMLDHASNASISKHNPGITSLGIRYGYLFD